MNDKKKGVAVVFGGSGFIGSFFARQLIEVGLASYVYLYDNKRLVEQNSEFRESMIEGHSEITFVHGDIRHPIEWEPSEPLV